MCYFIRVMKILAATDLSDDTHHMIAFTAKLVKQCGSKMYLLHMVPPCVMDMNLLVPQETLVDGYIPQEAMTTDCPLSLLESSDRIVKKLAKRVSEEWRVPIYGKAEEADDLVSCLNNFCMRHHIDMLVINNRQRSLLGSLLLGNTAEKLMRHIQIPIIVVPSQGNKA